MELERVGRTVRGGRVGGRPRVFVVGDIVELEGGLVEGVGLGVYG